MTVPNFPDGNPGWVRAAQIGLDVLAVILSIYILVFPGLAVVSIVYFVGEGNFPQ